MHAIESASLQREFVRRWHLNQTGGLRARVPRWRVAHGLLLQRMGKHVWMKGRTFWGDPMHLLTGEVVSRAILGFGYAEAALTALMLRVLRPGMRFVDIGAHLGYEAMLASRLVGPSGRVVSFEPQAQIVEWTERNLRPYRQARLVRSAVGEQDGAMAFAQRDLLQSAFSGRTAPVEQEQVETYTVPLITLDSAIREDERPVDFVKCDVEGGETAVLHGSRDILATDRPVLVLEAEMPEEDPTRRRIKQFTEILSPSGYVPVAFEFAGELIVGPPGTFPLGHANIAFVHPSRTSPHDFAWL